MKYRQSIQKALDRIPMNNGTRNPDQSNIGGVIGEAYLWDTVQELAASKSKAAWDTMEKEGFIPPKDLLREKGSGEVSLVSSDNFTVISKVTAPRASFDKDAFIDLVAKKFKIDKHKLVEASKSCTKESRAPVSLKIMEI